MTDTHFTMSGSSPPSRRMANCDFFTALFTTPVARLDPSYQTTFSMTPRERRLESYRRYRGSFKGLERTFRYNRSPAHLAASRRYRDSRMDGGGIQSR